MTVVSCAILLVSSPSSRQITFKNRAIAKNFRKHEDGAEIASERITQCISCRIIFETPRRRYSFRIVYIGFQKGKTTFFKDGGEKAKSDLGLNLMGCGLVLDLLEHIADLEAQIHCIRNQGN